MDNQHRKIEGYRDFDQAEIDLINECKQIERLVIAKVTEIQALDDTDKRNAAVAKTSIQTGFMWLVKAIAKPEPL